MNSYATIAGRSEAEIEVKKSRFIAHAAHVGSEEEALAFIDEVRAENRMARHNVYAYVIRDGAGGSDRIRYSDDGEPQKTAGLPTLSVIQHAKLSDLACVTTRYFGGVLLGTGGLVRAYAQAAREALDAAKVLEFSRCIDLELRIPYSFYDGFMKLVEEHGAKMEESTWSEAVSCRVRMLEGRQDPLLKALAELTRGSADPRISEAFDAVF